MAFKDVSFHNKTCILIYFVIRTNATREYIMYINPKTTDLTTIIILRGSNIKKKLLVNP